MGAKMSKSTLINRGIVSIRNGSFKSINTVVIYLE